ncbi:hypothetical protein [Streptomyces cavernae]|uniref:hypothetical protein n=1 Tax=Streptomyces cavernae TaxID=2259034 RepID=UPI000FEB94D8|nr:hypothetical protein [Streptomyces cavernae]
MNDHRLEGPGEHPDPVPRDLPDQQTDAGEDPWEVSPAETAAGIDEDVPDTDEAGSGKQGTAPRTGTVHPEHPGPEESPD